MTSTFTANCQRCTPRISDQDATKTQPFKSVPENTVKSNRVEIQIVMLNRASASAAAYSRRPNMKVPYMPPTSASATGIFLIPQLSAPSFHHRAPLSMVVPSEFMRTSQ